jgi:hypothetical protein
MKLRDFILIYVISLVLIAFVGFLQQSPGYMDSEYYAVTGSNLWSGKGFTQNFLWNYLDDPVQISHPSNTYWMPGATILSAPKIEFVENKQKTTLWVVNILFSSLIPVLTAWLAFQFTHRRSDAWMAGLLGLFSGFYLLYYAIPETFSIVMILGTLLIILLDRIDRKPNESGHHLLLWGLIGIISGILHMTRAEGLLWLGISAGYLIYLGIKRRNLRGVLFSGLMLVGGYLLVSGSWYLRNLNLWHQFFPPGTSRALWITNYDQMFAFPADQLTASNWLKQNLVLIFSTRWTALGMNLKSMLAVQGGILLVPFIIAGWVINRKDQRMILAGIYYALVFLLMTFVFSFAGPRGGFIHSAAGIQLFLWAMVPVGLDRFIQWGGERRGWKIDEARRVFQIGLVVIMALLTSIIFYQRVIQKNAGVSTWLVEENKYQQISAQFIQAKPDEKLPVVMIKNPPGWTLVTGMPSIVIPDGDVNNLLLAADTFHAGLLVLEKDHPKGLDSLYQDQISSIRLKKLFNYQDAAIYLISPVN